MSLTQYGFGMIFSSAPALLGVLHELRHRAVGDFHARLWVDPLAAARSRAERRHLRRGCGDCSMIYELWFGRLT